jgi:hypothetical protein
VRTGGPMADLVAFLNARLGEDEDTWQRAQDGPQAGPPGVIDRQLREVEAKRAILTEHSPGYPVTYPEPSGEPTCYVCHAGGYDWDPERWPCLTVRALAAIWRDHPDYDPAWKP